MTAGLPIACNHPFCHLIVALGFLQSNRPGLCAGIYPFLGFDPLLEKYARSVILIAAPYVHLPCPLGNPLVGFFPLRRIKPEDFLMCR